MEENIKIIMKFIEEIKSLNLILRFIILTKEKQILEKKLQISKRAKKSSDITAISDLMKKLNESLIYNKKKLKYLEEDYLQRKNQINQIIETIDNSNLKIQELTKQKKKFFNLINKITREMEGSPSDQEKFSDAKLELNDSLTNAEKIKKFQMKAKKIQFKINQIKSKIKHSKTKFEEINPFYETYKKDYDKLLETIKSDEEKLGTLQSQLKEKLKDKKTVLDQEFDIVDFKSIKQPQEIEDQIQKIENNLSEISIINAPFIMENQNNISLVIKRLEKISRNIENRRTNLTIEMNEENIKTYIKCLQNVEMTIYTINTCINKFLKEINLNLEFKIIINSNIQGLYIHPIFIRTTEERVYFDNLTTPEKIFFVIVFYITIYIYIGNKNIIFSNLFITDKYNKAGSIFRTIRKILPLFESEEELLDFNLIFIISNLEMKKDIKNLKIIKISEKNG